MLNIEFAQPSDTVATPGRSWSGTYWYTSMSINIPENVDVMVVRYASRYAAVNPSAVSLGHRDTGSFMDRIGTVNDGNLHSTAIYHMLFPPSGPTILYLRSFVDGTDRCIVDYLKNVNIKSIVSASSAGSYVFTSSLARNTSPGDLVLDIISKGGGGGPTASATQTVQVNSQDSATTAMWYAGSYTFATGSTTTMAWTTPSASNRAHITVVYTPSPGGRMDVTAAGQNQIVVSNIPSQGSLIAVV